MLFIPKLPSSYAVWLGEIKGPEFYKTKYAVDEVHYTDDIIDVLKQQKAPCQHVLQGTNTDR